MITIFHRKKEIQVPNSDFKFKIEELESDLDTLNRQLLTKNWQKINIKTIEKETESLYGKGFY